MADSERFERIVSVVIAVAAVAAVALMIEGRLNPSRRSRPAEQNIEYISEWRSEIAKAGVPLDTVARTVQVAVFTDFECPFCKNLDSVLIDFDRRNPAKLSRTVVHFPLSMHRYAKAAAQAFECAVAQGSGAEMHHILYEDQAKLADRTWSEFATRAHVADLSAFNTCVARDTSNTRIANGVALGKKLGVIGTPTVMVNGWLISPSDPETVIAAVTSAVAGKTPSLRR
jgi:protein-disulfide isomerase